MSSNRTLPNWINAYMHFTRNSEPPHLFRKWIALGIIAATLQRKCSLPWGSLTFYPNLYTILVAPSGKARKGTAMDPGMDFLTEPGLNIKLAAEATTRESLIRELRDSSDNFINPETSQMIFHASLTVFSQELTVFLGYHNCQLISDLTDWYDCRKKWTYRTKWSGTDEIDGVWMNLIGATTPELIQSAMPMDAIGIGLTSRMIFVFEEKRAKAVPDPFLTKDDLELRNQMVRDLERIVMLSGPFRVTEEFVGLWTEWYLAQDDHPPFEDSRFSGYFERRPAHVMKLSMILNASRTSSMTISGDDLNQAIQLLEETEIKMPRTFSGLGRSSHAATLSRMMVEISHRKETTFSEIMNIFRHDAMKWDVERILETLEAMKFCTHITNTDKIIYNENFGRDKNVATREAERTN